ncbi:hypothetical protein JNK62_04375 [bacterium]|nr:hypothetical protein [bacterium]
MRHLTKHARERILLRTELKPENVLQLINDSAAISLGKGEIFEYLLFFSPFDLCCKIAVVSHDWGNIVSVWDEDFDLPEGILVPTERDRYKAKKLYQAFTFRRIGERQQTAEGLPYYSATIDVVVEAKTVYSHAAGEITRSQGTFKKECIKAIWKELSTLASITEENRDKLHGFVQYQISLKALNGIQDFKRYAISHKKVLRKGRPITRQAAE